MELKFKKLREGIMSPSYGDGTAIDLFAAGFSQEFDRSGKMILAYHTGLSVQIPEGYVGIVVSEPSIVQRSVMIAGCTDVVTPGDFKELVVRFKITTDALPTIYKEGEKIAQLLIVESPKTDITVIEAPKDENAEPRRESGAVEGNDQPVQA